MFDIGVILKLFDKGFVIRLLLLSLLYTLLPLSEIFLIIYMSDFFGQYLLLALAASTGLFGVLIALVQVNTILTSLKEKIRKGEYPAQEFINLAGILTGGILLITPGFITDFIGLLMFFPPVRNHIGRFITKKLDKQLKEIHEYLKLYEL
ncbi:MAG: FxsA family protein [Spirochaetales bacterium]|nr:FxsA family protein [Spirochaetales bacterium]